MLAQTLKNSQETVTIFLIKEWEINIERKKLYLSFKSANETRSARIEAQLDSSLIRFLELVLKIIKYEY